ncbi:non-specific lipid-transfer protein A-like [Camellia sinensis]|uniref:non-specific lipid-transfer protein A-like n=1 Tax=Camellia sinensis TaxID=4442 RepID=UPI0010367D2E|nr:non-specific lipid-transfer protein A-like [Camellia sinensis]
MKGVVIVMVVLAMILLMVEPSRAISCGQVDGYLAPCVPYLIGGSGSPAPTCCGGVKNIKGMASTTADNRAACNCVKQAADRCSNLKDDAAQPLAAKCSVQMDIPVSRTTNCDIIN